MSSDEFSEVEFSSSDSEVGDVYEEYQGSTIELPPRTGSALIVSNRIYAQIVMPSIEAILDALPNSTKYRTVPTYLCPENLRLKKEHILSKKIERMVNNTQADVLPTKYCEVRGMSRASTTEAYRIFYNDLAETILLRMYVPWYNWPKIDKSKFTKQAVLTLVKKYNSATLANFVDIHCEVIADISGLYNNSRTRDSIPLIRDELWQLKTEIQNINTRRLDLDVIIRQHILNLEYDTQEDQDTLYDEYPITDIPWDPEIPERPDISAHFNNYPGDSCMGTEDILKEEEKGKICGDSREDLNCIVCTNIADVLQHPCKHCIYCIDCIRSYYKTDIRLVCSVCKADVKKFEYLRPVYKRKRK